MACFLSHVHSDHLLGLESPGLPFIYCSPATKEVHIATADISCQNLTIPQLLIRLEKYYHRINFDKGFLESTKRHYKHLERRLVSITILNTGITLTSPENNTFEHSNKH